MRVVVDSSVLLHFVNPNAAATTDRTTGSPVEHCYERVLGLLDNIDNGDVEVVIPAPVLSEILIGAGAAADDIAASLNRRSAVTIAPFGQAAAMENASLRRTSSQRARDESKKQVSFDLQIMAIARVVGAAVLYSDDLALRRRCESAGMRVAGIADLPVPDRLRQQEITLPPAPIKEPEADQAATAQPRVGAMDDRPTAPPP